MGVLSPLAGSHSGQNHCQFIAGAPTTLPTCSSDEWRRNNFDLTQLARRHGCLRLSGEVVRSRPRRFYLGGLRFPSSDRLLGVPGGPQNVAEPIASPVCVQGVMHVHPSCGVLSPSLCVRACICSCSKGTHMDDLFRPWYSRHMTQV